MKPNYKIESCFEIFLLVLSIVAFSYILSFNFEIVKADVGDFKSCCENVKTNNATCQDMLSIDCENNCNGACLPTSCSQTDSCKVGCCFDTQAGTCMENSPKGTCNGQWFESKTCNVQECERGCCSVGAETMFITETTCRNYPNSVFKPEINNELSCLILSHIQKQGACIIGAERDCTYITKEECLKLNGNFNEDLLCTAPSLNTACNKTKQTTCVDGKDEVYFKDSCGNIANIYDSSKITDDDYWTRVVPKSESCNSQSQDCGNCGLDAGTKCGKEVNKYVCRDLNCKNAPDNVGVKDRKNGESWCIYDSYVGDGKDVIGSRHWKYYCLDGVVKSEACGDYRQGICVESKSNINNEEFSNAACKVNRWRECIDYNSLADSLGTEIDYSKVIESCNNNVDCYLKEFNFGEGYHFFKCLPKYPTGLDLNSEKGADSSQSVCGAANIECKKIEQKVMGGYECVAGCDCGTRKFVQDMNDMCVSLGDCGGYINLAGKTDDAYSALNSPKINLDQYLKYLSPVSGQKAQPETAEMIIDSLGENGGLNPADFTPEDPSIFTLLGIQLAKGAVGVAGLYLAKGIAASTGLTGGEFAAGSGDLASSLATNIFGSSAVESQTLIIGSQFLGAASAAMAGSIAGYLIGMLFGVKGDDLFLVSCGSGTAGMLGAIGSQLAGAAGFTSNLFNLWGILGNPGTFLGWLGPGLFWGLVAALILSQMIGDGEQVKETTYTFKCMAWQAPSGGSDCDLCNNKLNKNGLRECSKYKCSSLGQNCELLNEGTGNEICIDNNPNNVNPPTISAWQDASSTDYEYYDIANDGFKLRKLGEQCIQEFSQISFGISTDEPSQCKMDLTSKENFDSMNNFFGDSNLYTYNHSMQFNMPSVDSLIALSGTTGENKENLTSYLQQKFSDIRFYIRCKDKTGNENKKEFLIRSCVRAGPDLTSPYIIKTDPSDGLIGFNTSSKNIKILVNEPVDCKFSYSDKTYSEMENTFNCNNNLNQNVQSGFLCSGTANNLVQENRIYIKCKDQPWQTDDSKRNVLSTMITLTKTPELKILSLEPNSSMILGVEPSTIILKAKTSGGVPNQVSCDFSFSGYNKMTRFFNTFGNEHTQVFDSMTRGNYTAYVRCSDKAGNVALSSTGFSLYIDSQAPQVSRLFKYGGNLKIFTDENAYCYYSNKNCEFNINNATLMKPGNTTEHYTEGQAKTFYIRCKDNYGNIASCSIVAKLGK